MVDSCLRGLLQTCVFDHSWPAFHDLLEIIGLPRECHDLGTMVGFLENHKYREKIYRALEKKFKG